MLKTKVKAGALSLVLIICLLLASILSSIMLLAYYRNVSIARTNTAQRLQLNASSGLQYLLSTPGTEISQPLELDLYGAGQDSVRLLKEPWGVFNVYVSVAKQGAHTASKLALVGVAPNKEEVRALYLIDEDRPLMLSGNTSITGNCYLPRAGVKATYVDQVGFQGGELIKGKVFQSEGSLPKVNPAFAQRVNNYCLGYIPKGNSLNTAYPDESIVAAETGEYSFLAGGRVIKSDEALTISNTHLSGRIIILSKKEVHVKNTASLQNVIISAPVVRIEAGFQGALQAFATDSIIVGSQSKLLYPSALCMQTSGKGARLLLQEGAEVAGLVYMGGTGERLQELVRIAKDAWVSGFVYVDGLVEHRGAVEGSLACRRFYYQTPTSVYENHLVDASINSHALPEEYLSSPLLSNSTVKGIVKWLR